MIIIRLYRCFIVVIARCFDFLRLRRDVKCGAFCFILINDVLVLFLLISRPLELHAVSFKRGADDGVYALAQFLTGQSADDFNAKPAD